VINNSKAIKSYEVYLRIFIQVKK